MATIARQGSSSSLKYVYRRIAAFLAFAVFSITIPQVKDIFENIPGTIPDKSNPSRGVSSEAHYMNTYSTTRSQVSLVEESIDGTLRFTIEDKTNFVIREVTKSQFENLIKEMGDQETPNKVVKRQLKLSEDQITAFNNIGFEPIECEVVENLDTSNTTAVNIRLSDRYIPDQTWEINLNGDESEVFARIENPEEVLTMPLPQFDEMNKPTFVELCEG